MKIPKFTLPHRVTISSYLGEGPEGPRWEDDPTRQQKNVHCRIESRIRTVKTATGSDVIQVAEGVFHPDSKIKNGDKIIWDLGQAVFTVEEWTPIDAMGLHSLEVVLSNG